MKKWIPIIVLLMSTAVNAQDPPAPPAGGNTVADLITLVKELRASGDGGGDVLKTYTEAQLAISLSQQVAHNGQLLQSHADHRATINEASSARVQALHEAADTHVKAQNVTQAALSMKGTDEILRLKALRLKEAISVDQGNLNNITNDLQAIQASLQQNAALIGNMIESVRRNSAAAQAPATPAPNTGAAVVPKPNAMTQEAMSQLADALNKIRVENPAAYTAMKDLMVARVPNPTE